MTDQQQHLPFSGLEEQMSLYRPKVVAEIEHTATTIGKNLRRAREAAGYSYVDVEHISARYYGEKYRLNRGTIRNREIANQNDGTANVRYWELIALADLYKMKIEDFFRDDLDAEVEMLERRLEQLYLAREAKKK